MRFFMEEKKRKHRIKTTRTNDMGYHLFILMRFYHMSEKFEWKMLGMRKSYNLKMCIRYQGRRTIVPSVHRVLIIIVYRMCHINSRNVGKNKWHNGLFSYLNRFCARLPFILSAVLLMVWCLAHRTSFSAPPILPFNVVVSLCFETIVVHLLYLYAIRNRAI